MIRKAGRMRKRLSFENFIGIDKRLWLVLWVLEA